MTDNPTPPPSEPLPQVGWWCWRGDNHGHLATQPCRSDNVPIHAPAEWADEMRAVIQRVEDGDEDEPAPAVPSAAAPPTQAALLDSIAGAVRSVLPMSSSLTHDVVADAVLAVLPDRAAETERLTAERDEARATYQKLARWSREDAEALTEVARLLGMSLGERTRSVSTLIAAVGTELRRLAAEQPTETQDEDPARIDRIRPEFTEHASVESIDAQLRRARSQQRRWHLRVEWLIGLRQARVEQQGRGEPPAVGEQPDTQTREAQRCPAKHGALGRICKLPLGHTGMHTGSGPNGGAVWDGDAP
ncbi:hypothetical protein [Streptomyces sp. NPDC020377]|uniref:hypothetical protein n=1 Tax=Streptomyces sp. NPDC020377 TaxID=3365070 RepID=UPI0037B5F81D